MRVRDINYIYLCIWVSGLHVFFFLHHMHALFRQRRKEGVKFHGTEIIDSFELPGYVGSGNLTWDFWEGKQCAYLQSRCSSPRSDF